MSAPCCDSSFAHAARTKAFSPCQSIVVSLQVRYVNFRPSYSSCVTNNFVVSFLNQSKGISSPSPPGYTQLLFGLAMEMVASVPSQSRL